MSSGRCFLYRCNQSGITFQFGRCQALDRFATKIFAEQTHGVRIGFDLGVAACGRSSGFNYSFFDYHFMCFVIFLQC